MPELAVESVEWWVARLSKALDDRARRIALFEDYYNGEHRLAFATEKFRTAFGALFAELSDNFCPLVVEAVEERLNVRGFRIPRSAAEGPGARAVEAGDEDAWRIWQANQLDFWAQVGHTEALIGEEAFALVWADPDDEETPVVTIEHPTQMIVEDRPGTRRRAAALKRWRDDWTGRVFATLYLPEGIYKLQSSSKTRSVFGGGGRWEPREVQGESWPLANPLGVVPIVPLQNKPRLIAPPKSEIATVIPIQDAINKTVADMLVASEFGAIRRRWATGVERPRDPKTGEEFDPFDPAIGRLWTVKATDAKFGEFHEQELNGFIASVEMFVQHVATQTRTPPHYFFLTGQFPSGESIKSAETGLVAKTTRKMTPFGEAWEEVIRLGFAVLGDDRAKVRTSETIWADPESRSESEHIDAVVKKRALGVPAGQLWEDAGYSPQQIARFKEQLAEEALAVGAAFDPFASIAPPAGNGNGIGPQPAPAGTGAG